MEFNKQELTKLNNAIKNVLIPIEEQFGIKIILGNGRYSHTEYKIKFTIYHQTSDSNEDLRNGFADFEHLKNEFKTKCWKYGLSSEDYGRKFKSNNVEYTIIGIKSRNYRFPIIVIDSNGNRYKYDATIIRSLIGK